MTPDWNVATLISTIGARDTHPAIMTVREGAARTWTSAALVEAVRVLAAGLIARGFQTGEAAIVCAPNAPAWIVSALAIERAGGVLVAIDDNSPTEFITAVVDDFGGRFVFTSAEHLADLKDHPCIDQLTPVLLDDDHDEARGVLHWRSIVGDRSAALPELTPRMPACLFYTSGTTGTPKAFILTHAHIAAVVTALDDQHLVDMSDRLLMPLPFHHIYPWVVGVLTTLQGGAAIVLPEAVTGPQIVAAAGITRATVMSGVPRLYDAMVAGLRARLSARASLAGSIVGALYLNLWRLSVAVQRRTGARVGRWLMAPVRKKIGPNLHILGCGGARLEPATAYALEGLGFEVLTGYGLAETASIFTVNVPDRKRLESAGRTFIEGSDMRVVDPNAQGIGEIQLRGPGVFSGYRNNPEANADAFTGDGWFRTGDLGFIDADGFLTVTGRSKEQIVLAGGKNIEPEPLEKIYATHPYIGEIALLELSGELVALVRPDRDGLRRAGTTKANDAVRVALAQQGQALAAYQRPVGFAIASEALPRTRLGKLQRFKLPSLYQQARSGVATGRAPSLTAEDQAYLAQPVVRDAWAVLRDKYRDKPLHPDASLALDLGVDSFERMALVAELEARLGRQLEEDRIAEVETVRQLLEAVKDANALEPGIDERAETAEKAAQWLAPAGSFVRLLGALLYGVVWLTMRLVFRLRIFGRERLPQTGPFVLAPNHVSDLDPLAIVASLPYRRLQATYWAGDVVRLFATPIGRLFCRASHIFPADERRPAQTIAIAQEVLSRGLVQVWFPEAWRSPDGKLQRFMPGISKLVLESGAPVVPVFIAGAFEAMPRDRRLPKPKPIRVAFGDAIELATLAQRGDGETEAERVADGLRVEMVRLARSIGVEAAEDTKPS